MQTDPIGYEDNVNLYGYVGQDPINGVDPTGMYDCGAERGQACQTAAQGVREIRQAADILRRPATGSRIADGRAAEAADELDLAADEWGTMNDGNGVVFRIGTPAGSSETSVASYVNGVITYSPERHRAANRATGGRGFLSSLGGILAHEIRHDQLRNIDFGVYGLDPEVSPLRYGYLVDRALGRPGYGNVYDAVHAGLRTYCGKLGGPICDNERSDALDRQGIER